VASLAGELIAQLRLPKSARIALLKHSVECCAGVPASEQRLVEAGGGQAILEDDSCLADLAPEHPNDDAETVVIQLTLVRVQRRWALSGDVMGSLRLWDLEQDTQHKLHLSTASEFMDGESVDGMQKVSRGDRVPRCINLPCRRLAGPSGPLRDNRRCP